MILKELSTKEFDAFALTHPQNNFHQTTAWGEFKAKNGWKYYRVGLEDENNNILAASLLLSKGFKGLFNIFYAPRGFLIDYNNFTLLKEFTKQVKLFSKKKKAMFIKIDPYVMYKERDINGDLVEDGINNADTVSNLKKLGYIHKGFTIYQGSLQPRWMFVLDVENKTEEEILKGVYQATTRHCINKTLKWSYEIVDVDLNNIDDFKEIMFQTSKRRGYIDRPLSYYKDMYNILGKYNMVKMLMVKFDCQKSISKLEEDLKNKEKEKEILIENINQNKVKRSKGSLNTIEEAIENNNRKIKEIKELSAKHGNIITMASALFMTYGDEVLYLYSGAYEEFLKYDAPYRIQWEMISYAIRNGFKRYNFYGISGAFDKNHPSYGIYTFKKGFNGCVVELIGEYDLIVNRIYYTIYNIAFKVYRQLKNIKKKRS